jgi:hypothetical protein
MKYYRQQLLQALKPADKVKVYEFDMQKHAATDNDKFDTCLIFSNEAAIHLIGKVNCLNVHTWRLENPCAIIQQQWDMPQPNVSCAIP